MKKTGILFFIFLANFAFAQKTSAVVHFAAFQAQLNSEARLQIETLLEQFSPSDELQVDIYSYTDDKEAKKQPFTLSEKRNDAVLNFLLEKNYKIKATHTFIGGKLQAEVPNNSEEERAQNRRTLLIVNRIVHVQPQYFKYERATGIIPSKPKPFVSTDIFASSNKEVKDATDENILWEEAKALQMLPE